MSACSFWSSCEPHPGIRDDDVTMLQCYNVTKRASQSPLARNASDWPGVSQLVHELSATYTNIYICINVYVYIQYNTLYTHILQWASITVTFQNPVYLLTPLQCSLQCGSKPAWSAGIYTTYTCIAGILSGFQADNLFVNKEFGRASLFHWMDVLQQLLSTR